MEATENTLSLTSQVIQQSRLDHSDRMTGAIATSQDAIADMKSESSFYDAMKDLLSSLETFQEIARTISEVCTPSISMVYEYLGLIIFKIHPFLQISWSVVSGVIQVGGRLMSLAIL